MSVNLGIKLKDMKIQSTLTNIAEAVFTAKTVEIAKSVFLEHISASKIKQADKEKMLTEEIGRAHV